MKKAGAIELAVHLIRRHGGLIRTREALALGIHPRTLRQLVEQGLAEQPSRGLYRLAELPPLAARDWVVVARRVPGAVICLVSALEFHQLTTQIAHQVDVAIRQGSQRPALAHPPLRVFWYSPQAWSAGVEVHTLDGTAIRVFDPAKTVADCFKYRHKIGMDIALEALRSYRRRTDFNVESLLRYARLLRIARVLQPYVEALL